MRLVGETGLLSVVPGSRQHGDDGSGGPQGRSRGGAPRRQRCEGAAGPGIGAARSGAPRLGCRLCGGGVVGFDAANVRCGVVGAAGVAVGRVAVAARWRALSTCRGAGWGTRCFQGCSRRSAATGIAGFGQRVSPWWPAVAVQQPGAWGSGRKRGPGQPRWLGSWPGPMAGVAGYRVCSIGNAWALKRLAAAGGGDVAQCACCAGVAGGACSADGNDVIEVLGDGVVGRPTGCPWPARPSARRSTA